MYEKIANRINKKYMTCIAVRVKAKKIEIAGDTQTSWGQNKIPKEDTSDRHVKSDGKIFQVNGMTFGCAGQCSHIGLLQIYSKTHKPKDMERDDILDWFIEFKQWVLDKAKIPFNDLNIAGIIINNGRAFVFYDWVEAYEIKSFNAVGSGMWLALGAMELGADVEKAVDCAIKYDKGCGGKVTKLIIDK